ncbi:MAG: endopeptidase La [Lactobacillales bacterium]|nr:endopeptidase La [Lactobacillales bacterium]
MIKTELPVIILRGIVLLPNNDIKLEFDNDLSKSIIDVAELFHDNKILIVSNENPLEENVNLNELPKIGVISKISHKIELPNGKTRLIITGLKRANVIDYLNMNNKDDILEAIVSQVEEEKLEKQEENALIKKLYREIEYHTKKIPYVSNSVLSLISNITSLDKMTDIVISYLQPDPARLIEYLNEPSSKERLKLILEDIYSEQEMFEIEKRIDSNVRQTIDENQRQYILKEKIKEIKRELNDVSLKENEIIKIKNEIEKLKINDKIKQRLEEEINRYENTPETSPESSVIRNYIDWLINIPWSTYTEDNDDLDDILNNLDKSHSGLKEIKERFIEYIAVRKKSKNVNSPIICLVGPPGVGKTSFVYSLANALKRNFVKMSVGGVNDEAEIIGHRRTYLGSSPGRIIKGLKKAKSMNPIFLIDEIDKMTKDQKGDPASVLLEVLDKEQNKYFSDNFIEEEVDLSDVMFITTANYIENIPEALRDRLEIIEISGYTEFEKLEIAKNYLIKKICIEHGIESMKIEIEDKIILKIIRNYTKESGVRELERVISKIIRKIVTELLKKKIAINKFVIDEKALEKYLGQPDYEYDEKITNDIGVVTGLSYTKYGGDALPIEVNCFKGNGNLILTGSLGDVMKESAKIALSYIKANYKKFKIDYKAFKEYDIHIHVPEGAIKKDGPSAGITLTTAIISLFTNKKIANNIAFTGEITLRGNVLKIGGLKEKSIGALRRGINKIIIPKDNLKETIEFDDEIKKQIEYIPVSNYMEIFELLWR